MAHEEQLQQILAVVNANGTGLVTIIDMLTQLPVGDNPELQDEIDAILAEARTQQDAINQVLNPAPNTQKE